MQSKVLAFAGSAKKESFNKRLVEIAASGAKEAGAQVTLIDLADYPMPLFNEDLESEEGMPETAQEFKRLLIDHDAFIIASPEYNSAFSPLLKNVIDWASRAESSDEQPLEAFRGKMAAVLAATPGPLGGLRGLVFLRMLLANIGVTVLPDQQTVPQAFKAFGNDGMLLDEHKQDSVKDLGRKLAIRASTVSRLNG